MPGTMGKTCHLGRNCILTTPVYVSSLDTEIQSNFYGSNTSETMQISSRQGKIELMRVEYSARSGGFIWDIFFDFL